MTVYIAGLAWVSVVVAVASKLVMAYMAGMAKGLNSDGGYGESVRFQQARCCRRYSI